MKSKAKSDNFPLTDNFPPSYFDEPILQEILALTGGGKSREYTETRPDGTTVTYTIDVEEEVIEVSSNVVSKQLNEG